MKIELREISISELVSEYADNQENGVVAYGGKLDVRPPYQREFVYGDKERMAVIDTVMQGFPLNVMYWAVRDDGTYEIIDGQQRTISICQYVKGDFAYMFRYFHNLTQDEQQKILDYKLMVYFCEGTDSEKLKWFETINIAGKELTKQELRNAVYSGSWVSDAKRYFSKNGCVAYQIGGKYLNGSAIRQEYLETAIAWLSKGNIEVYMSEHQHDKNALALWQYFQSVITWVEGTFVHTSERQRIMKGVDWGELYDVYHAQVIDTKAIEDEIRRLILDDDVTNKKGIFAYVLTRKEKHLNIRAFSEAQKLAAYECQQGVCAECGGHFELSQMEADHITPWHAGGRTIADNC
ncbi:MAG: HNH endonuclease family protein [Paludibacteraceae bacterium]